jgi:hypothetical protein
MLKEAGLGIGFGKRKCIKCADEVVASGDLRDTIPLIQDYLTNHLLASSLVRTQLPQI